MRSKLVSLERILVSLVAVEMAMGMKSTLVERKPSLATTHNDLGLLNSKVVHVVVKSSSNRGIIIRI